MIKNDMGQEAKESLKEIIGELFINDIKKINEENSEKLKKDLKSVENKVVGLNLTLGKIEDSSEDNGKKILKRIEESKEDILDKIKESKENALAGIEEIVKGSTQLTNEIIGDKEKQVGDKIEILQSLVKDVGEEHKSKLSRFELESSERNNKVKEEQDILINQQFERIQEILRENQNLVKNEINEVKENQEKSNKVIDEEITNVKNDITYVKETLISKLNEMNAMNTKKNYIFYSIIIALLLINILLLKL
ncbi:MAG: hypothetical protein ACRC28_05040 [Clostridium sp.]|uniref:hypothetical protein n=1 Tax=Clostridium sp. TaxID=1506 RepID=UPI003F3F26C7